MRFGRSPDGKRIPTLCKIWTQRGRKIRPTPPGVGCAVALTDWRKVQTRRRRRSCNFARILRTDGDFLRVKSSAPIIRQSDISRVEKPIDTSADALFPQLMHTVGAMGRKSAKTKYLNSGDSSRGAPKKVPRDCARCESIDSTRLRLDIATWNDYFGGVINSSSEFETTGQNPQPRRKSATKKTT